MPGKIEKAVKDEEVDVKMENTHAKTEGNTAAERERIVNSGKMKLRPNVEPHVKGELIEVKKQEPIDFEEDKGSDDELGDFDESQNHWQCVNLDSSQSEVATLGVGHNTEFSDDGEDEYLPPCTPAGNLEVAPRTPRAPRKSAVMARIATEQHYQPGGMLDSQTGETQALEALGVSPGGGPAWGVPGIDFLAEGYESEVGDETMARCCEMYEDGSQDMNSVEYKLTEIKQSEDMIASDQITPSRMKCAEQTLELSRSALLHQPDMFTAGERSGHRREQHQPLANMSTGTCNSAITTPPRAAIRPTPATAPHPSSAGFIRNERELTLLKAYRKGEDTFRGDMMSLLNKAYIERDTALLAAGQLQEDVNQLLGMKERDREGKRGE
ncbi:hypothetical protein FA13DRAFT_1795875 [Coprinellus micaceus]|uniref:Uncharacterized protein n=1 Tax=Coprinellus micaceus TaxID=71717 RepID=A0A4Y7SYF8_COPMI|nr:hypothetical protein FA13DRAFT_1795875 [Coprinellus micaceus]